MKEFELKLISELMKNSRRSDRELAKTLRVSQPTVTRTRTKLERAGTIREYTMIPDFTKLGYHLLGFTLLKGTRKLTDEEIKEAGKKATKFVSKDPYPLLISVNGIGIDKDTIFVTFYEDYSAFVGAMNTLKKIPFVKVDEVESFLADLNDHSSYRVLSMSAIANHILTSKKA
jgi:DNA-binding Lrp family transcriptional regulator